MTNDPAPAARGSGAADAPESLTSKVTETTNLLKAVVGLLGLLLPTLVVTTLIEIPLSLAELVKIITIPTSVVAVVGILLLGGAIRRWTTKRALIVFAACLLVGSSSAITFYLFAPRHVFLCRGERLVSPIVDSARVREIIEPFDNDYCRALRRSPATKELRDDLATDSIPTVILMILLMVATVLFLVGAMVGIAWKAIVGTEGVEVNGQAADPAILTTGESRR